MNNTEKMYTDLKNWIETNCGDDIVNSPFQRSEYAPFVVVSFLRNISREEIPIHVLQQLEAELIKANDIIPKPWWKFWRKK